MVNYVIAGFLVIIAFEVTFIDSKVTDIKKKIDKLLGEDEE
jgi:hypothetical protein